MRYILTILAVMLTAYSAYGVDVERLLNPGFEDGVLDPWVTDGWTIDTTDPFDGTYCASVDGEFYIEQSFTPTDVNDIASVTLWIRQPEAVYFWVYLYYEGAAYDPFFDYLYSNDWTEFDHTEDLRSSGNLEKIRVIGYGGSPPDYTYLDNVSIMYDDGTAGIENTSFGNIKAAYK